MDKTTIMLLIIIATLIIALVYTIRAYIEAKKEWFIELNESLKYIQSEKEARDTNIELIEKRSRTIDENLELLKDQQRLLERQKEMVYIIVDLLKSCEGQLNSIRLLTGFNDIILKPQIDAINKAKEFFGIQDSEKGEIMVPKE